MKNCGLVGVFLAFLLGQTPLAAAAERPSIVTSIAPLTAITAALLDGVTSPESLLSGARSHHGFHLSPKKARLIFRADLVIWLGPEGEPGLRAGMRALSAKGRTLAVLKIPGLQQYPQRRGHEAGHDHAHAGGHHHHAHAQGTDPHIWLDTRNGRLIAQAVAARLIPLFPQHKTRITQNEQAFLARADALDVALRTLSKEIKDRPYAVFHDAFQYFEKQNGLHSVGALTLSPERALSARRLSQTRQLLKDKKVVCLFVEPQFSARLAKIAVEGTQIRLGTLDPVGTAQKTPDPNGYFSLIRSLAENMRSCLLRPAR